MSRRELRPRGALNHALHRAYDALLPHRRHDPARLEESRPVNTDRSTGQPPPVASLQPPSGTSPMDPESARTALLPYVTLIARHQVQLSVSPPLQRDIRTQRRLNDALGFDQVLAAVQPLSDTLPDLPHAVGELTAQLKISREEAATAKHLLVPVQLRVESLETLLNKSTAELNGLQAEIKRLKSANVHIGSLLEKSKESMDVQTENRRLAMNYAEQKQDIIDALDKQIKKEREVFKTTVSANTENTRKLHDLLLKATQGTWVDSGTAALVADLKDRNLHLLRTNRALRGFVSFAGMDPNTLALAIQGQLVFEPPRSTFQHSTLTRTRSSLFRDSNKRRATKKIRLPFAEALAKTAQQVQSSASKRIRHGSDDGSSDDLSEEKTPVPSGRASRAGSSYAKGLEEQAEVQASKDCFALAGFRSFTLQLRLSPLDISAACAFALSGHAKSSVSRPRYRSHSVSSYPTVSKSPASPTSVPATPPKAESSKDDQPPAVVDLTRDESDEDIEEEPVAVPTNSEGTEGTITTKACPQAADTGLQWSSLGDRIEERVQRLECGTDGHITWSRIRQRSAQDLLEALLGPWITELEIEERADNGGKLADGNTAGRRRLLARDRPPGEEATSGSVQNPEADGDDEESLDS
ncbi:hypothetical protein L917_02359 [Phytophthora nicotianae]|uniref:Uncharacterized protein n=1 Tax=Phytophthora nicotianae TaxID=4792 RepID=W2LU26_PHYNI|nr:hypothetical protein L917_02359 [Phytophthora nicotianae]